MFVLIRFMGRKCLEKQDSTVLLLSSESGQMKRAAMKCTRISTRSESETRYAAVKKTGVYSHFSGGTKYCLQRSQNKHIKKHMELINDHESMSC